MSMVGWGGGCVGRPDRMDRCRGVAGGLGHHDSRGLHRHGAWGGGYAMSLSPGSGRPAVVELAPHRRQALLVPRPARTRPRCAALGTYRSTQGTGACSRIGGTAGHGCAGPASGPGAAAIGVLSDRATGCAAAVAATAAVSQAEVPGGSIAVLVIGSDWAGRCVAAVVCNIPWVRQKEATL